MTALAALYPTIKLVHIGCVTLSLSGFVLRWLLTLRGAPRPARRWVRVLPHLVDSLLLASAITMAVIAGVAPLRDAWLTAKLLGLLAYIALGMIALRHGRTRTQRAVAGVAAVGVFGYIVTVALTRSPWGMFAALVG